MFTRDSFYRVLRTFLRATLVLFIPGLLGWLHDLTQWANGQGTTPFPDAHGLAFLLVSATVAGCIAVVELIWNTVEDHLGKGMFRNPPPLPPRGQAGAAANPGHIALAVLVAVCVGIVVLAVFG